MSDNSFLNGSFPTPGELVDDELMNVVQRFADLDRAIQSAVDADTWPPTKGRPRTFRDLASAHLVDPGPTGMTAAELDQVLLDAVERLAIVAEELGLNLGRTQLAPEHIPAADTRPRREVWASLLETEARYTRWSEPIRVYFLTAAVNTETDRINNELGEVRRECGEDLASWSWDPEDAAAYADGYLGPVQQPAVEEMLAAATDTTMNSLADVERVAVSKWLENQITGVRDRDWYVTHRPGQLAWTIDRERQRLHLTSPDWTEWDEDRAARMNAFAAELAELTEAPTDPASVAYPQATPGGVDNDAEPPSNAIAPTEGPVR